MREPTVKSMRPFLAALYIMVALCVAMLLIHPLERSFLSSGPSKKMGCTEFSKKDERGKPTNPDIAVIWARDCEILLAQRRQEIQNDDRFVYHPGVEEYMLKAKHAKILAKINAMGRRIEDEKLIPVKKVSGEVFTDTNGHECYAARSAAEAIMKANQEFHERTGNELGLAWCYRPPELQAVMWVRTHYACTGSDRSEAKKQECANEIRTHVAKPYGSSHGSGYAFDIDNWRAARDELLDNGFIVGCTSNIGHKDKRHADWIGTEGGLWSKATCNAQDWFKQLF